VNLIASGRICKKAVTIRVQNVYKGRWKTGTEHLPLLLFLSHGYRLSILNS